MVRKSKLTKINKNKAKKVYFCNFMSSKENNATKKHLVTKLFS